MEGQDVVQRITYRPGVADPARSRLDIELDAEASEAVEHKR